MWLSTVRSVMWWPSPYARSTSSARAYTRPGARSSECSSMNSVAVRKISLSPQRHSWRSMSRRREPWRSSAPDSEGWLRGAVARRSIAFTRAADVEAVALRHHDVEHHQVGGVGAKALERTRAVLGLDHAMAVALEGEAHDLADVTIVVGDQHTGHGAGTVARGLPARPRGRIAAQQRRARA